MCGIAGITWEDKELIRGMTDIISHRGPDGQGYVVEKGISLGHRRLSIIDLSDCGKQPMANEDGAIWLTFNGEIYNYKELASELKRRGHRFISNTDTEVIIHGYEEYGIDIVKKLNGMFAFGLWDCKKGALFLARDRVGIKPLYYALTNSGLAFASEVKSLLLCPSLKAELNKGMIDRYFALKIVPGAETMFKGIYRLEPGCILEYSKGKHSIRRFWELLLEQGQPRTKEELSGIFLESIDRMLMSDVPLGVYLSGGLDSSAIVGAMKTLHPERAVHTFTMGFDDPLDEYHYARKVADAFGTEHHELIINFRDMTKHLPKIVWHLDEPVANPAVPPTYMLSAFSKKNITVALMGQGSDEFFAGYSKYKRLISPKILPPKLRFRRYLPSDILFEKRRGIYQDRLLLHDAYAEMKSYAGNYTDTLSKGIAFDIKEMLPNFLLNKDDKLTMSSAVEGRVPYLDNSIIDFASKLPNSQKINKTGKYLLKEANRRLLPSSILSDKKRAFYTPLKDWLNLEILPIAENNLSPEEVARKGIFRPEFVKKMFHLHKTSIRRYKYANQLFSLFMFDLWHRTFIEQEKIRL